MIVRNSNYFLQKDFGNYDVASWKVYMDNLLIWMWWTYICYQQQKLVRIMVFGTKKIWKLQLHRIQYTIEVIFADKIQFQYLGDLILSSVGVCSKVRIVFTQVYPPEIKLLESITNNLRGDSYFLNSPLQYWQVVIVIYIMNNSIDIILSTLVVIIAQKL